MPEEPSVSHISNTLSKSALIVDGAALLHILQPGVSKTFNEYLNSVVWQHVEWLIKFVDRLDIVFDRYIENSFKSDTRQTRGSGQAVNVTLSDNGYSYQLQ